MPGVAAPGLDKLDNIRAPEAGHPRDFADFQALSFGGAGQRFGMFLGPAALER